MPHTLIYNAETHIVETKVHGRLTLEEAKELIAEIGRVCVEKNCFLCLTDYRETTLDLSTLDLYDMPKILADILAALGLPANRVRRAVVIAKSIKDFKFYETVTLNSGQNVRLFQDIEDAKKWLLKKQERL